VSDADAFSDPFARYDAAYLLGALSPEDRQDFVEHLRTCADCSASVKELAGLPGLLARVSPDLLPDAGSPDEPPVTLLPALLAEVRRGRQRRQRWTLVGAVAATAAAVLAIAMAVTAPRTVSPPVAAPAPSVSASAPSVTLTPIGSAPIRATAQLQAVAWGTRIVLRCTYSSGDPYGADSYSLVVLDRTGRTEQVGTWKAVLGKESVVQAATALLPAEIAVLEVRSSDGASVLRVETPTA
jgi:hypothetical protein